MQQKREYKGIEYFKLIAALLVIAIHTSPLETFSPKADFILSRVIGRVAVPFFFMVTGYFVLPNCNSSKQLTKYIKKTGIIYVASLLLYLPVSFYSGSYYFPIPWHKLWRDLLFNGTFYHLWYLPAAITGFLILFLLLKYFKVQTVCLITFLLYFIGLFGDSYYGLVNQIPFIKGFYDFLFAIFEYTRNGIFMAPIFILMGYHIRKYSRFTKREAGVGLAVSVCLLLLEGYLLFGAKVQRHDSMYISLLPSMYFLFKWLSFFKGGSSPYIKSLSLYGYLLHPIAILILRGIAKVLGIQKILLENSLIYYSSVVLITGIISFVLILIFNGKRRNNKNCFNGFRSMAYSEQEYPTTQNKNEKSRAWIELNLTHLSNNVKIIKSILPKDCDIMAIVKANAYGHGDLLISKSLNEQGIYSFGVATLSEGIRLRKGGINGDILILGYTHPSEIDNLVKYELTQTIVDSNYAQQLNSIGKQVRVHIKVDTGMHRLGEKFENIDNLKKIFSCKNLIIKGTYSHLCTSDQKSGVEGYYAIHQIQNFNETIDRLEGLGYKTGKLHLQSSYGMLNYPQLSYDYARAGIALYGLLSSGHDETTLNPELKPVLSVKARVSVVKDIQAGESVGYGCTYTANDNTRIAAVTIGYADGIPRILSQEKPAHVLINGSYARIVGRICMDQMEIDVTHIPNVTSGDIVTIIGEDLGKRITAEEMADNCSTITNEILSRLGERLERITC